MSSGVPMRPTAVCARLCGTLATYPAAREGSKKAERTFSVMVPSGLPARCELIASYLSANAYV
jgi:hypothetical protein